MDIKNKVAIVTGGSGGIGFATVQALLKNGVKHVAIFDVNNSQNITCLQNLDKEFGIGRASVYTGELTTPGKFDEFYDAVVESQKNVDILINSLGIINDVQPRLTISVNVVAVIECTISAIERMGKHNSGTGGVVLNIASVAGLMVFPIFPVYLASKHAIVAFTSSLKEQYNLTGVRALTMCPGATTTSLIGSLSELQKKLLNFVDEEQFVKAMESWSNWQPPENVATAIVKMIQQAESGTVWVSEENEPPYEIKELPFYKERKILV